MKFSIITVNKNNCSGLEKTIQSVINQTFTDFDYVIIDGNSTDGSVDVIKKYSSGINYWVSEPDTGIYNAMNKGIQKVQGEYCLFLNSGDYLISSSTLDNIYIEINNMIQADIFYSDKINSDGTVVNYPKSLTINYLIKNTISHQNSLIRRSLFMEHNFYNEELNIASDWEFFLKELWKYKSKLLYIKTNISVFDINGLGSRNTPERFAENMTVYQNVFQELTESIIELNYYRITTYYNIIENYGNTILLVFILRVYKFFAIISNRTKRFFSRITLRALKLFMLINKITIYLYELFLSFFDKKLRICFTNFGDIPQDYFIVPLRSILESAHHSYKIVKYYNPHIHFFSVFGNKKNLVYSKAKCKIFFSGENVNDKIIRNGEYKGNCVDNVSLSSGFDYLETENYLRFPLWLLYYFSSDNSKDKIRNILNNFKKHYQKVKFCSLVASHDRSGIRTKIYNEISKIAPVDCPGALLHNDDTLYKRYADNKAVYLQLYKFNICPENSVSPGYVTEKIFQSLYSGCIPIYNGWSKNPEPDILNPNIILWYEENEVKPLIEELKKLYVNDKYYCSFMEQPFFCDTAVDKIHTMLQQFTDKIHYNVNKTLRI